MSNMSTTLPGLLDMELVSPTAYDSAGLGSNNRCLFLPFVITHDRWLL